MADDTMTSLSSGRPNGKTSPQNSVVDALRMRRSSSKMLNRTSITSGKLLPAVSSSITKFLQAKSSERSQHSSNLSKGVGGTGRARSFWKKLAHKDNPKKIKMMKLKRKIRIAIRLSLFLRYWWYKHLKSVENMVLSEDRMDFLTKLIKDQTQVKPSSVEEKPNKDILFDVTAFKANKHQKIPLEARRILTILPQYRTDSEVHYVMIALRSHKQIANCPVRMQTLIARYGVLESFDEKRCIVKQGHPPQAFYYIFYGSVAVAVDEGFEKKVVCVLERGESFGELAIVSDCNRQSSVISKTEIELISIKKEIYEDVFMAKGSKRITDPDHEEFIRSLDFLNGFPTELLDINPKLFVFTYFQRGAVMVRDSNSSDWLYVIKSGSVDVLKKLVKSKTTVNERTGRQTRASKDPERERFEAFVCGNYFKFYHNINNRTAHPQEMKGNIRHLQRDGTQHPAPGSLPSVRRRRSLSAPTRTAQSLAAVQRANAKTANAKHVTPKLRWRNSMKTVMGTKVTLAQLIKKHLVISSDDENGDDICDTFDSDVDSESMDVRSKDYFCPPTEELPPSTADRGSFRDGFDNRAPKKARLLTQADLNPQFVKVQTLTKGSTFGLADIVLGDQPSLCLVSNGVECIMINKEFYTENCPQRLQGKLLQIVSPYPEDEVMQEDLLTKLNWDAQRNAILKNTVRDIKHQLVRVSKVGGD